MRKNYNELTGSIQMLSVAQKKRWYRYWRLCFIAPLFVMALLTMNYSASGQNATNPADIVEYFGVDGDVWANTALEVIGAPVNTDDWFGEKPGDGTVGWGVIDQMEYGSGPSIIDGWIAAHWSFELRMNAPRWSSHVSADGKTYEWIDAVYGRDNISIGKLKDSTTFTGTSDKNAQDPTTWNLGIKGSPQKNDLVDVFGYIREEPVFGHKIAYGAASTISADGSSHTDFEFFRNDVTYEAGALVNSGAEMGHMAWIFNGDGSTDRAGDLIVSTDFEKGGKHPTYSVRVWMEISDMTGFNTNTNRPFDLTGIYNTNPNGSQYGYVEIVPYDFVVNPIPGITADVWATVNVTGATQAPPWGTLNAKGVITEYEQYQITELAIDMTAFGLDVEIGESDPCVSLLGTLLVKTRSSASFTAELKDFAGPYRFGNAIDFTVEVNDQEECDGEGPVTFIADVETENIDASDQDWLYKWYLNGAPQGSDSVSLIIDSVYLALDGTDNVKVLVTHERTGCERADSSNLVVHENPVCDSLVTSDARHVQAADGTAKVYPSGGTPPYTYLWTADQHGVVPDGQDTLQELTGLVYGWYYVTIEDAKGCVTDCQGYVDFGLTAPSCIVIASHIECYGAKDGIATAIIDTSENGYWPPYVVKWTADLDFNGSFETDLETDSAVYDLSHTIGNSIGLDTGIYKAEISDTIAGRTSCLDTVTTEPYKPLNLICFPDTLLESCQTQGEIDGIFDAWLDNYTATGGTPPLDTIFMVGSDTISLDELVAPDKCGGTITVYIYLSDWCDLDTFCSGTFTVPTPEAVDVDGPASIYYSSCDFADQTDVDTTFANWLAEFVVTNNGGCDAEPTGKEGLVAPDICDGDTINVVFAIDDGCTTDTVRASFGVSTRAQIDVEGPGNEYYSSCEFVNQAAVDAKFKIWKDKFKVLVNECKVTEPDLSGFNPPDVCKGDTVTITYYLADLCSEDEEVASFGVSSGTPVWAKCNTISLEPCLTEAQIDAAFSAWKAGFTYGGGCNPQTNIADLASLDWNDGKWGNMVDGYLVTFELLVWDIPDCSKDTATCTFTIPPCAPECGTVYGYLAGSDSCFMPTFSNWGWSNIISPRPEVYKLPLYEGNSSCDIITPQVGMVTITYPVSGNMIVHYEMYGNHYLSQVHVNVGCDPFVQKGDDGWTVAPGQYNYDAGSLTMATEFTVEFTNVSGGVWVITHGVACEIEGYTPSGNHVDKGLHAFESAISGCTKSAKIVTDVPVRLEASDLKVYPNPFSDKITFEFVSGMDAHAVLEIHNILGQKVSILMDQQVEGGVKNSIEYMPTHTISGIYIYKLSLDDYYKVGRLIYKKE